MKDRLIELLNQVGDNVMQFKTDNFIDSLANYLQENGVIVLPCKIGDVVYGYHPANGTTILPMVANAADRRECDRLLRQICEQNEWRYACIDNHAKLVLLDTDDGKFIIETSSNLNENPSIEHFSFEKAAELYDFYQRWFDQWFAEIA